MTIIDKRLKLSMPVHDNKEIDVCQDSERGYTWHNLFNGSTLRGSCADASGICRATLTATFPRRPRPPLRRSAIRKQRQGWVGRASAMPETPCLAEASLRLSPVGVEAVGGSLTRAHCASSPLSTHGHPILSARPLRLDVRRGSPLAPWRRRWALHGEGRCVKDASLGKEGSETVGERASAHHWASRLPSLNAQKRGKP